MSSNALNQVYKTGILAIEQSLLTQDENAGATTLHVSGKYMTDTPFVVGKTYVVRDDTDTFEMAGSPNMERIRVTSVNIVATPMVDGIGYSCAGTIGVEGYNEDGWLGGILNNYTTGNNAAVLTPGIEMAIQSADFNCRFKTLADAPKIDPDDESERFATGDEGRDPAIMGARSGEITFTQKLAWAGAVSTVPKWRKIMESLGHVMRRYTSTGIGFLPHTWANEITATIWILAPENGAFPTSTVYRYRGAHGGNGSSIAVGKVGDVYMLTAKYNAAYVGTMDISIAHARSLTSPETTIPEVMLSNSITVPSVYGRAVVPSGYAIIAALVTGKSLQEGSRFYSVDGSDTTDNALAMAKGSALVKGDSFTVDAGGTAVTYVTSEKAIDISQFSLDFGAMVTSYIDQSTSTGNAYFATTDRDPRFTCNPYHVPKGDDDMDFVVTNGVCGKVKIQSALTSPHLTIDIPNAQLLQPAIASREGYVNTNRTYRPLRNNQGAGKKESELPDQVMYEILIGDRS